MPHKYFRNLEAHARVQEILTWGGLAMSTTAIWYIFYGRRTKADLNAPIIPTRLSLRALIEEEEKATRGGGSSSMRT